MSSSPLLMRVEELMVTTGPMSQVGCLRAAAALIPVSSARLRPRKGPPEAVRTSRRTSLRPLRTGLVSPFSWRPLARAWAMAECSESTGTIWPGRVSAWRTRAPPTTRDSLLARARRAPLARAASVGSSPTEPVMPLTTVSPAPSSAAWTAVVAASGPVRMVVTGSGRPAWAAAALRAWRRRSARSSPPPVTATTGTSQVMAWRARSSRRDPPAARAATRGACSPRRERTSSVWVPIDPVDPRRTSRCGLWEGAGAWLVMGWWWVSSGRARRA